MMNECMLWYQDDSVEDGSMYACMDGRMDLTVVRVCVCVHACVRACVCVHVCVVCVVCVRACVHARTYMHMCVHIHAPAYFNVTHLYTQYTAPFSTCMINFPRNTHTCDHNWGMAELSGLCNKEHYIWVMHAENLQQHKKCQHQRWNDISLFTTYSPEHSTPLKIVSLTSGFQCPGLIIK